LTESGKKNKIIQYLYIQYLNSMTKKSSAHTLEYILLGLIREQPDHGYALFERLRNTKELSLIWQVKRSKLYYLLDKLESDRLLTSSVRSQGPYPDRNVYQITPEGDELLQIWLHAPVLSSRYVRLAFLSKLYFVMREDPSQAVELINNQIEVCQGWVKNLEDQLPELEEDEFINHQVYQFRIGQVNSMIQWLIGCRDTIPGKSL
jgi:DNA-binding PadR family transcriptional regulator